MSVRAGPDRKKRGRIRPTRSDNEAFAPPPFDANAGTYESRVTERASCPFCAAAIKRKTPHNAKTSYYRKRKRAQGTLSLPRARNLPVTPLADGASPPGRAGG